jgi:hypothetical protein
MALKCLRTSPVRENLTIIWAEPPGGREFNGERAKTGGMELLMIPIGES